ncbi:hypothetical protein SNE40_007887 [Patella caerulea]|uniref:M-phase inducer phosphatase n=1 Tax=Patella caerulea TaxID=87958 RepID=A0AAN8PY25_PATCE
MRRCMEEIKMNSSPTLFRKSNCLVPNRIPKENRLVNVVKEEEIQDRDVVRIKLAVERLSDSEELIADCSRPYTLPTICGKHKDLKSITPQTLTDLFSGEHNQFYTDYTIIDCRYPYEYNGGHIQGAVNIYTKQSIDVLLQRSQKDRSQILIFHCEFSSQRAPTLLRYLRAQDRMLNSQNYPRLYYPEVYILNGGYKAFYEHNQDFCNPSSYVPMLHEDYRSELHHIRTVTKSQTEREKTRGKSKTMSRVVRF